MKRNHRMPTHPIWIVLAALLLTLLPTFFAPRASMQDGNYQLKQSVIAGGGGVSANGSTRIEGTIGQSALGVSTGGTFSLSAGFWQPNAPCAAPSITAQPVSQASCVGSPVTFSTAATGNSLTYQWRKDMVNITDATSASFTINNVTTLDAGSYDVVINGACGNKTSDAATLTVNGYSLSASGTSVSNTGGSGSVNVITATACSWTALSNDGWITITSGASGTGNGMVNYNVAASSSGRTGTLTIAGITYTVSQDGPTAVTLVSFAASRYDAGVYLEWRTGMEVRNLGFNVYRETKGQRAAINPELLAGTALQVGANIEVKAGGAYGWWDDAPDQDAVYWLEDFDLNGVRTLYGPVKPQPVTGKPPATSRAGRISQIAGNQGRALAELPPPAPTPPKTGQISGQLPLAAKPAIKLTVREAGWYRVTRPELLAAGIDPQLDPRRLQLYLAGVEQPILVTGEADGRFDQSDAIEFYGTGQDTPETDAHVYWLVAGDPSGKRIQIAKTQNKAAGATSLAHTIELKERSIYFAGLLNGDAETSSVASSARKPLMK